MGNFINFCIDSTNAFFYDDYDDYHRLCKESYDYGVERIPSDNVEAINSNYDLDPIDEYKCAEEDGLFF